MKSNKLILLLIASVVMFSACQEDEQIYDKQRDPTSPILTIEGTTNLIVKDEMEDTFYGSVLSWTRANYGKGISAAYTMEVSGNEYFDDNKVTEAVGTDIYLKAVSVEQLIKWATETFGEFDEETEKWQPVTLYFRIIAQAVDVTGADNAMSGAATINVSWYEPEPVIEEITIGFKIISAPEGWDELAVYSWGGDQEAFGGWPGKVLEPNKEGWYSFVIPAIRPINLIINNNDKNLQFNFLVDPAESACYEFVIGEGRDNCDWTSVNCPDTFADFPSAMYMIGQDFGGWSWESDGVAVMNQVNGYEGHFWAIRYIRANQGFKWNSKREWDGDFNTLGENLGFTLEGGNAIVDEDGMYMIYIDMPGGKISVEEAKVFGMGDCFGGWDMGSHPFAIDGATMKFTTTGTGELRMYANSDIAPIGDGWWRMEFVIFDGVIAYRGNEGDQERVTVEAGKTITLDFNTESATIE